MHIIKMYKTIHTITSLTLWIARCWSVASNYYSVLFVVVFWLILCVL